MMKEVRILKNFTIKSLFIGLYGIFDKVLNDKEKLEEAKNDKPLDNFHGNFDDSIQMIDTVESVDSNDLSPRTRQIHKVTKSIVSHFRQTGESPTTSIEFYKIGK